MFLSYFDIDVLTGLFSFVFGVAIGSFINVVVDRLIADESLGGRSHCDYCKKVLAWYDLIPIVSFFVQQGRCRYCHAKLSLQYPLVEAATGILFVVTWFLLPSGSSGLHLLLYWGIVSCGWIIFISDLKYQLISDCVQIAFFLFVVILKIVEKATLFSLFFDLLIGVCVLAPIALLHITSKGKAMGEGDIGIAFNIGFLLGFVKGFLSLYIGFIFGAAAGIYLLFTKKKKMRSKIAFGPFLVAGMCVSAVWGDWIIAAIRKMYGL